MHAPAESEIPSPSQDRRMGIIFTFQWPGFEMDIPSLSSGFWLGYNIPL